MKIKITKASIQPDLHPDCIELTLIQDIYKSVTIKDDDGEEVEDYVLVKKDARSRETIWKNEITSIKEIVNENGNVRTKRIQLNIKYRDAIVIEGTYKEMRDMLFNKSHQAKTIGFNL